MAHLIMVRLTMAHLIMVRLTMAHLIMARLTTATGAKEKSSKPWRSSEQYSSGTKL
jgi:hypothetical protein